jgi:hypothetical protein
VKSGDYIDRDDLAYTKTLIGEINLLPPSDVR